MPKKKTLAIILIVFLGIIIYYSFDPSGSTYFPKCPFYVLTGYKCPGCGSQRAIHHLLHLHLLKAINYNALMVFSIPLLFFLIIADLTKKKHPQLYLLSRSPILSWSILAIVLLWWLIRNLI